MARIKGSHHFFQYQHGETKVIIVVPVHGSQIKVQYVKDVIDILDELFPEDAEPTDDEDDN